MHVLVYNDTNDEVINEDATNMSFTSLCQSLFKDCFDIPVILFEDGETVEDSTWEALKHKDVIKLKVTYKMFPENDLQKLLQRYEEGLRNETQKTNSVDEAMKLITEDYKYMNRKEKKRKRVAGELQEGEVSNIERVMANLVDMGMGPELCRMVVRGVFNAFGQVVKEYQEELKGQTLLSNLNAIVQLLLPIPWLLCTFSEYVIDERKQTRIVYAHGPKTTEASKCIDGSTYNWKRLFKPSFFETHMGRSLIKEELVNCAKFMARVMHDECSRQRYRFKKEALLVQFAKEQNLTRHQVCMLQEAIEHYKI